MSRINAQVFSNPDIQKALNRNAPALRRAWSRSDVARSDARILESLLQRLELPRQASVEACTWLDPLEPERADARWANGEPVHGRIRIQELAYRPWTDGTWRLVLLEYSEPGYVSPETGDDLVCSGDEPLRVESKPVIELPDDLLAQVMEHVPALLDELHATVAEQVSEVGKVDSAEE